MDNNNGLAAPARSTAESIFALHYQASTSCVFLVTQHGFSLVDPWQRIGRRVAIFLFWIWKWYLVVSWSQNWAQELGDDKDDQCNQPPISFLKLGDCCNQGSGAQGVDLQRVIGSYFIFSKHSIIKQWLWQVCEHNQFRFFVSIVLNANIYSGSSLFFIDWFALKDFSNFSRGSMHRTNSHKLATSW